MTEAAAATLAERAARVLPGGATHIARTYQPPIYVTRAQGSRKWLVDGRQLVDYTMGHGAMLLGHAHPAVVAAVQEQLSRGTHYGAGHPLEVEWAERIAGLVPSAALVRFTASGTEAAMLALRVARVATGRDRIIKLVEHFHGWSDAMSVEMDAGGTALPMPGVPSLFGDATRVVPPDAAAIHAALADRSVAALILEPTGAHYGRIPMDASVVRAARQACDDTGSLLIFDEVVSGFRMAPGGMQQLLGIRPDLSLFGKVMAGGLPAGAVGGQREVMAALAQRIAHAGTYNANPLSASAGITTLDLVAGGEPQRIANAYAARLADAWESTLKASGVPGSVHRLGSIIHVRLDEATAQARIATEMRARDVDLLNASAFCSSVHSDDDLQVSADAFAAAVPAAAQAGLSTAH